MEHERTAHTPLSLTVTIHSGIFCFAITATGDKIAIGVLLFLSEPCLCSLLLAYRRTVVLCRRCRVRRSFFISHFYFSSVFERCFIPRKN